MPNPMGMQFNMGVNTQFGGMAVQPTMNVYNSLLSANMNKPSVMTFSSQQNSAAAASRLFVPPQFPAPSQHQRTVQGKVYLNNPQAIDE